MTSGVLLVMSCTVLSVYASSAPPLLMHFTLIHMFHFTAQLDAHQCWDIVGTPDSTLGHFTKHLD